MDAAELFQLAIYVLVLPAGGVLAAQRLGRPSVLSGKLALGLACVPSLGVACSLAFC
jgi:hypothetical protein